jgi:hypothetical protein
MEKPIYDTKLDHLGEARTYNVQVTDVQTGEVIQRYDTETAILFGVVKGEKDSVAMVNLGDAQGLNNLLFTINGQLKSFIFHLVSTEQKLNKKQEQKH